MERETVQQCNIAPIGEGLVQVRDALACVGVRECVKWDVEAIVNASAKNPSVVWLSAEFP